MEAGKITPDTKLFGILGEAVETTKYPQLLNGFFGHNVLDAFSSLFNVREEDLPFYFNGIKNSKIAGLYMDKSRREAAYLHATTRSSAARFVRRADALRITDGKLEAELFLGKAVAAALARQEKQEGPVAILGHGPEALAIGAELVTAGIPLLILAPSPEEAMEAAGPLEKVADGTEVDLGRFAGKLPEAVAVCRALVVCDLDAGIAPGDSPVPVITTLPGVPGEVDAYDLFVETLPMLSRFWLGVEGKTDFDYRQVMDAVELEIEGTTGRVTK